jgi:hypothetical protein
MVGLVRSGDHLLSIKRIIAATGTLHKRKNVNNGIKIAATPVSISKSFLSDILFSFN